MSESPHDIPEELQVLAGEFVLGALDAAEMRAVRRQAEADARLAAAIKGWEERLAPLAAAVPAVAPPPALWSRIDAAVTPHAEAAHEPVALHAPAQRLVPPARPPRPPPPRRRVWPWQLATGAALALAAGLAAVVVMKPRPPGPLLAALTPASTPTPGFLAEAQPDGRLVLRALTPTPVPPGRDLELWILPKGGKQPTSLGVLPAAGRQIVLPAAPAPGTQLMVSLEPEGGSTTGAPTGPVLYAGTIGPPQP
ncbi:MAG: anti-sigma factor [Alphaproteobacteria bacterium]|nr:anti-sigma factor [Alphaproteobacteria bacterium]